MTKLIRDLLFDCSGLVAVVTGGSTGMSFFSLYIYICSNYLYTQSRCLHIENASGYGFGTVIGEDETSQLMWKYREIQRYIALSTGTSK